MRRKLFFDFDGTLIDPRRRLYDLFHELVPASRFTFDEYWNIKRGRVDQQKLLSERFGYSATQIAEFKSNWLRLIEDAERLVKDVPFDGVGALLEDLSLKHDLYLVTARQRTEPVAEQLSKLGWGGYFKMVLVTQQRKTKAELIKDHVAFANTDVLVGDTGEDIQTAQELGLIPVAVASGFLSAEILSSYKPRFLLKSVLEIYETRLV